MELSVLSLRGCHNTRTHNILLNMFDSGNIVSTGRSLKTYFFPLLLIATISTFFVVSSLLSSERLEKLDFIARVRSLNEKAKLETQIDIVRAYEASSYLSKNESLIRWFSGDDNPLVEELSLSELESFSSKNENDVAFAARSDTKQFYLGSELADILSSSDPDDSWFYDTISMEKSININVDFNKELNRTMLWVNAKIFSENQIIGVAGIGLGIDNMLKRLENLAPGAHGMILFADELGNIKLSYPQEMYNQNLGTVLNDVSKKYVNLDDFSVFDFKRNDSIYTISSIPDLNLNMIIVTKVEDFLSSPLSRTKIYSLLSFILIIILAFVFLLMIFKFKLIITEQNKNQDITIHSMSILAELKDNETGAHIIRTKKYCRILAEELSRHPLYKKYLTKTYIEDLERSAPLHDIGKVGIPDYILLKPGKLTAEEFEVIKTHTVMGAKVLKDAMSKLYYSSYFTIGIQLVLHHHEKWDGTGYPDKLEGEDIPLSARIMAIADVYDALRSSRPYKKGFSHEKAVEIILEGSGTHFEPDLVDVFMEQQDKFEEIAIFFSDEREMELV
jgi:HD-GYP domain-containing protein (c-di-GMP phosphodiesterase class II)